MSPAGTTEIIVAKIAPLFLLLTMMMFLAIIMIKTVFGVPFHGGLLPVVGGGALCVLAGIGIGTAVATFSKSAQQALLTGFFINPIHHFGEIARGSMLKGSGLDTLWPNFLALSIITLVLLSLSVWRFRKQLS
jgi:ABC-2 type transport system permease protein